MTRPWVSLVKNVTTDRCIVGIAVVKKGKHGEWERFYIPSGGDSWATFQVAEPVAFTAYNSTSGVREDLTFQGYRTATWFSDPKFPTWVDIEDSSTGLQVVWQAMNKPSPGDPDDFGFPSRIAVRKPGGDKTGMDQTVRGRNDVPATDSPVKWQVKVGGGKWTWIYTFTAKGAGAKVTWLDPLNNMTGQGTWKVKGKVMSITWSNSTTTENWNLPLTPPVTGTCTMKGKSYKVEAVLL
jgi:hypothetical protein